MADKKQFIEKTVREMSKEDKKTFFRTVISVLTGVFAFCFVVVNFFSCKMDSAFSIPEVETDIISLLKNSDFEPVSDSSIQKISFLEGSEDSISVRVFSSSGTEEGCFVLTDPSLGQLSWHQCQFTVHISQEGSIRLIDPDNNTVDFKRIIK